MCWRRPRFVPLVGVAALLLAARCGPLKGAVVDAPAAGEILVAHPVDAAGRLGRNLDLATATVEVDGVDLVAALGLVPPFANAGGVVAVGPDLVTVSDFDLETLPQGAHRMSVRLAGLAFGPHELRLSAFDPESATTEMGAAAFDLVDFLSLELADTTSAGLRLGPRPTQSEGILANAALGQALAAPPVPTADGGSLRSGLVAAGAGLDD